MKYNPIYALLIIVSGLISLACDVQVTEKSTVVRVTANVDTVWTVLGSNGRMCRAREHVVVGDSINCIWVTHQ